MKNSSTIISTVLIILIISFLIYKNIDSEKNKNTESDRPEITILTRINGLVTDADENLPINSASIRISSQDSDSVYYTNDSGEFSIDLEMNKSYFFEYEMAGYQSAIDTTIRTYNILPEDCKPIHDLLDQYLIYEWYRLVEMRKK